MTEDKEVKAITNAILKAVIVMCICVLGGIGLHSCRLNSETIADCNDACASASGQMESVTSYKCTCTERSNQTSPWVLN
mgnify:CR=1 FL=1